MAPGVKPAPNTTRLDRVEGQMGSLSSRLDDFTSALGQVRELLIAQVPATDSTGSVSSVESRPRIATVSSQPSTAASLPSVVATPPEVRGQVVADDPLRSMAEFVIPSPGKNHPLVNMRSVAFNLPESVRLLIKNKSYVDLTALTKSKSKEPSSLCKTVTGFDINGCPTARGM